MLTFLLALTLWQPNTRQPKHATLVIAPATVSVPAGGVQVFAATTTGTTKLPVWSATGGTISQSGRYDAGTVPGIYQVTATLPANVKSAAVVVITSVTDTTAPTMPTNLTVSLLTETSFDLGWNSSSDAVGVTGYGIYVNGPLVDVAVGAGTSLSGLLCNSTSAIGIDAFDAAGNRSAKTVASVVTLPCTAPPDTTPPSMPGNFTASTAQTTAALTWTAATDAVGVVGYGVYLDGNLRQSTTGILATVTGLTCAQPYVVAVDAVDLAGNRSVKTALSVPTQACTQPGVTTLIFTPPINLTDVTRYTLEIRRAMDGVAVVPQADLELGKPAVVNGDVSVDVSALVDRLSAGSYTAIVWAWRVGGASPSVASPPFTK